MLKAINVAIDNNKRFASCFILVVLLLILPMYLKCQNTSLAQKTTEKIEYHTFNAKMLNAQIMSEINNFRVKNRLDTLEYSELLKKVSQELVDFQLNRGGKTKKTELPVLSEMLQKHGGSGIGYEISDKIQINNSNGTYRQIAAEIVISLLIRPTNEKIINNPILVLSGLTCEMSKNHRHIIFSIVLGSYVSENHGAIEVQNIPELAKKAKHKIKPYQAKECKRVERLVDLFPDIYKGLNTENGVIYFNIPENKQIRALMQNKSTGLAVDIIQLQQYQNPAFNAIDYSGVGYGITSKDTKTARAKSKNKTEKADKPITLGKMPFQSTQKNEINLIITQDNTACAIISPSYIEQYTGEYTQQINLLADTVTVNSNFEFSPPRNSSHISFRIPFDVNDFEYKSSDIEPLLKYLDEYNTVVQRVNITAYSSIEGNLTDNSVLQQRRAKSVVEALRRRQKENLISQIVTKTNWEQFKKDIDTTEFAFLAKKTIDEVQNYIRIHKLKHCLEPLLRNHRYADIEIELYRDSLTNNEEKVIGLFHNALDSNDIHLALSIQKYIMKAVIDKRYNCSAVEKMQIPYDAKCAGMLMNKLYMTILCDGSELSNHTSTIEQLHRLNPQNEYILYNTTLLKVLNNKIAGEEDIEKMQRQIQALYYRTFTKRTVDALNMNFQISIIEQSNDLKNGQRLKQDAINRIKDIFDSRYESVENALKLASLFISIKDYSYALEILDPYIYSNNYDAPTAFCWLSLSTVYPDRMLTRRFAMVLERACDFDLNKVCTLFETNQLPYRVFDNREVKRVYFEKCKHN